MESIPNIYDMVPYLVIYISSYIQDSSKNLSFLAVTRGIQPSKPAESLDWRRNLAAVAGELDELEATVLDGDMDGGVTGVEAVLDELLDGGDRPLEYLAEGDLYDNPASFSKRIE
ncbi:hypothetical protein RJ640_014800 [Escallonia rubra]|uniref:Uncharacterized protein n=1 Tax=Escallonia rubra TaxID=112253 RepID=A0AA88S198_9ASTE|nr:hypothetical protein RJ640_014800 [Escallonia rubra]